MIVKDIKPGDQCVVIAAHPDDEVLWAGGLMLMHPDSHWTVITTCRKSDPDRSTKFFKAVKELNAVGIMGDIDDSPELKPLNTSDVQKTIIELLPSNRFDLIITHNMSGEYTRHLRHEEVSKAVFGLCKSEKIFAKAIWSFAYEDGNGHYLPRAEKQADIFINLTDEIWQKKYNLITEIYGFGEDSFEAKTTPRCEAFWRFKIKH